MGDVKPNPREAFLALCRRGGEEFSAALPLSVPKDEIVRAMDRVVAGVRALAARNPDIYACSPASVGRAMALSALTGLVPGGPLPQVDLIPRRNKGNLELNWQIGFR